MDYIETLRLKLHVAIKEGDRNKILAISQELDIHIVKAMKAKLWEERNMQKEEKQYSMT